jgi:hypothetical protein
MGRKKKLNVLSEVEKDSVNVSVESLQKENVPEIKRQRTKANDAISLIIGEHFKLVSCVPFIKFWRNNFPRAKSGNLRPVARFYPSLSLVVDYFKRKTSLDEINFYKSEFEKQGYKYTYIFDGESFADSEKSQEDVFVNRILVERLKAFEGEVPEFCRKFETKTVWAR